jgi:hypothetical protein
LDILQAQRREPIESLATSFQKGPRDADIDQESGRLCSTYENQILLIPEACEGRTIPALLWLGFFNLLSTTAFFSTGDYCIAKKENLKCEKVILEVFSAQKKGKTKARFI